MKKIELSKDIRLVEIELSLASKKIKLAATREKCNDVLVEMVDEDGMATSKPLHKILPEIKSKKPLIKIRFLMNDFSTKPITISVDC